MLDAVAASKPDALLVAPNDVKASQPPPKRIQDAGTKVVLVDTTVTDPTIGVSRIATDNNLGGQKAAEALQQLGAKGKVLVISTDPGVSSVDARVDGFKTKAKALGLTLAGDPRSTPTTRQAQQRRSSPRHWPEPLTSPVSSRPTCSPPRALPRASSRPASPAR